MVFKKKRQTLFDKISDAGLSWAMTGLAWTLVILMVIILLILLAGGLYYLSTVLFK